MKIEVLVLNSLCFEWKYLFRLLDVYYQCSIIRQVLYFIMSYISESPVYQIYVRRPLFLGLENGQTYDFFRILQTYSRFFSEFSTFQRFKGLTLNRHTRSYIILFFWINYWFLYWFRLILHFWNSTIWVYHTPDRVPQVQTIY